MTQDGKWELKDLKFIEEFMKVNGLSTTMIAEQIGISRQSVYNWLKCDDMMISSIYALFESYGLKICFELNAAGETDSGMRIEGKGFISKKKRLGFFENYIKRNGITREQVAQMSGLTKHTVNHWFQFDDCFFSYICRFAEKNGLELKYSVKHIDK